MADTSFVVFDAFKSLGVDDAQARKASEALNQAFTSRDRSDEALDRIERRIDKIDGRLDKIDVRLDDMSKRLGGLDLKFAILVTQSTITLGIVLTLLFKVFGHA